MGKEFKVKCTEGHTTKYITNSDVRDDILCPQLVDDKPCKCICKKIDEGTELKGELEVPKIEDEMINKFFGYYKNLHIKQQMKFGHMWYVSTDNFLMIRKFDFDIDVAIIAGMDSDYKFLKEKPKKKDIVDDYFIKCYDDMFKGDKIIEFTKVKLDNVKKDDNFTLDHTKMFGYSGYVLNQVLAIFEQRCTIHIPDSYFLGYAKSLDDRYIIMFSPKVGVPEDIDTFKRFQKETKVSFDDDDIW